MKKVDIPQVLISTAAIIGIGMIWYDFNMKVFLTVRELMNNSLYDPDVSTKLMGCGVSATELLPTEETNN